MGAPTGGVPSPLVDEEEDADEKITGAPTGGVPLAGEADTNERSSGYPKTLGTTPPLGAPMFKKEPAESLGGESLSGQNEKDSGVSPEQAGPLEFSICDDDTDDQASEFSSMELSEPMPLEGFLSTDASPGQAVSSSSSGSNDDLIRQGGHEVILHIYDVSQEDSIRRVNKILAHKRSPLKFGGVFHAGVEILALEWSYGFSEVETQAGVSCVEPKRHPHHQWRQSVSLGTSPLTPEEIAATMSELVEDWPAGAYDLLTRNCCHFADDFCRRLHVKPIPRWVHRLARVGARADKVYQGFQKAKESVKGFWRREETPVEEPAVAMHPSEHYGRQPIFRAAPAPAPPPPPPVQTPTPS